MYPGRLRRLRENAKKTQKEVAMFLGITRQGYGNYENGITEPDNVTLTKLADYFEVSIDYLVGRVRNTEQVLSDDAKQFLYVVDLNEVDAVRELQERFVYKGEKIPEQTAKDILRFAKFNLEDKG